MWFQARDHSVFTHPCEYTQVRGSFSTRILCVHRTPKHLKIRGCFANIGYTRLPLNQQCKIQIVKHLSSRSCPNNSFMPCSAKYKGIKQLAILYSFEVSSMPEYHGDLLGQSRLIICLLENRWTSLTMRQNTDHAVSSRWTVLRRMFAGINSQSTHEGEDCLRITLTCPASATTNTVAHLPVIVFIHGGALAIGSGMQHA